jgi:hypothetical protein
MAPSLFIYFLIGISVTVAVFVANGTRRTAGPFFMVAFTVPFWPFFIPLLLAGRLPASVNPSSPESPGPCTDELSATIDQVDRELDRALSGLDEWAPEVMARHKNLPHELHQAWTARSERIDEIDRLLGSLDYPAPCVGGERPTNPPRVAAITESLAKRLERIHQLRRENIEQLRQIRRYAYEDLMARLAWVRELVSMIHMAKFSGAPASRAGELLSQIAAAAEGLSELAAKEESGVWRRILSSGIVKELSELTW